MVFPILGSLIPAAAGGADALDDVLCLFGFKALGQRHGGYGDVGQAEGAVADKTGQVDVVAQMVSLVRRADAVLLRACTVVNLMQQMGFGECDEGAEQRRAVDGGQRLFKVSQREGVVEAVSHLTPDKQANRCHANACIVEGLFIGNVTFIHGRDDDEGDANAG